MRFVIEQPYAAAPDAVARAFADPALYATFTGLTKLTAPEVLAHSVDGDVVSMQVRYHFAGHLSPAARAVLDPSRLTWVEQATHDLAARTTTFTMVPDHYRDRFRCSGTYRFEPAADGTLLCAEGEVVVKALLVAGAVEGAIVSGLREHLAEEAPLVERYLAAA